MPKVDSQHKLSTVRFEDREHRISISLLYVCLVRERRDTRTDGLY
jgi:hypothetical protein